MTHTDVLTPFQFRYACKKFNPNKIINEQDFQTILEVARLSPSSFGFEPWKFLVIERQSIKDKLAPVAWGAQRSLARASHFVILLARKHNDVRYGSSYLEHIMNDIQKSPREVIERKSALFKEWQIKDFTVAESDRSLFDWASKQTYIALANMMTAAAMMGIDSCPIEGFNRQAVEEILIEEGVLDPQHFGVSVMAGFGYRDEEQPVKTRQALQDVVQWVK